MSATTFYLRLTPMQQVMAIGTDLSNRQMHSCNYTASARGPVDSYEDDLAALLLAAGLVSPGTYYIGRSVAIPVGDGPFTQIISTSGTAPDFTQEDDAYETLTAQIVTYHIDYVSSRAQASAIRNLLLNITNAVVTR